MNFKALIIALVLALSLPMISLSASDRCVNCASGGSCKQCRLDGNKDNQASRKKCESMGCKIVGTSSCSTAANVKVCN